MIQRLRELIGKKAQLGVQEAGDLLDSTVNSIVDELVSGKNVGLPALGLLEVRSLPERRTVFFKSENLLEGRLVAGVSPVVLESIVELLRLGEEVLLPQLGTFRSVKKEDTTGPQISFTPSLSLRGALNGVPRVERVKLSEVLEEKQQQAVEEEKQPQAEVAKIKEQIKEQVVSELQRKQRLQEEKISPIAKVVGKIGEKEDKGGKKEKTELQPLVIPLKRPQPIRPIQYEEGDEKKKKSFFRLALIGIVCCIAVLALILGLCRRQESEPQIEKVPLAVPSNSATGVSVASEESTNLLDLAKKHYGNGSFWIYIYNANIEKLSSPVFIPLGTDIRIPNLKEEYNIDVTDSLEIKRASLLAEKLLRETKK